MSAAVRRNTIETYNLRYIDNENLAQGYEKYEKIARAWKEISELLSEIDKGEVEKLEHVQEKIFEVCELEKNALQILKRV